MILLVDQDGPLADFEYAFLEAWKQRHPDRPYVPLEARRHWMLSEHPEYPADLAENIWLTQGFYRNLPLVPGARETLEKALSMGIDVRICTTPTSKTDWCVSEKIAWVREHLGNRFVARTIITHDKTLVHGHFLLDDKPVITGVHTPSWHHVRFETYHNRHLPGPSVTWDTLELEGLR